MMADLHYKTRRAGKSIVVPNINQAIESTLKKVLPDAHQQQDAKRCFKKQSEDPRPEKKVKMARVLISGQLKRMSPGNPTVASSLKPLQLDPKILAISELHNTFSSLII